MSYLTARLSLSSTMQTSPDTMTRAAIDGSGCLGSLYDGWQDEVLGKLNVSKEPPLKSHKMAECVITNGNMRESQNLLQMAGIEDELRLSVLLDSKPKPGIASLVDYPHLIDNYTRILHYYYSDHKECLPGDQTRAKKSIRSSIPDTFATHVITSVSWGIDAVVFLQLPSDDKIANAIDSALEKLRLELNANRNSKNVTENEEDLFKLITPTTVYSNIPDLIKMTTLSDVYRGICKMKMNQSDHRRLTYTLCPIQWLYPEYTGKGATFIPLKSTYIEMVEEYLLRISSTVKKLKKSLEYDVPELLCGHLDGQLREANRQWSKLKQTHAYEIQRLKHLIVDIRKGHTKMLMIDEALSSNEKQALQISISDLDAVLDGLTKKGQLIRDIRLEQVEYYNAAERGVRNGDDEKMIEQNLVSDSRRERVLCSNDRLKDHNQKQWDELFSQLIRERQTKTELRLIYADFSYCSKELNDMMILPLKKKKADMPNSTKSSPSPSPSPSTALPQPSAPSSSSNSEIINILLLGESGVGKSTFINAFANYLIFKTLEEAQSNKPIVLIPVSFLITVNDQFEEKLVKFGNVDDSTNEDHNHPGQSVTQHCRSYVFDLNDGSGTKLRIIDTPGFGDTRGLTQDDLNMQHILTFINNLTHLHAVCILLKPNASRLNIFFKSCLTQLFEFLGENARDNIIFCFTNARSTFFAPGNTAPLLQSMLQSLSISKIPFGKRNTFCFDSESFRYLLAVQNATKFSDQEKHEYEISWLNSVTESRRLLQYIHKNLTAYRMHVDWKSIKHAQLEITQMIRPMLEAMRNILRNVLLWDMESPNVSIELCPKVIDRPSAICFSCQCDPHRFHNFWIRVDRVHEFQGECHSCECIPNRHISIDYALEYKISQAPSALKHDEMSEHRKLLCHASAEFSHFLMYVARSTQSDPFLSGFDRMISEENEICAKQNPCHLNKSLCDELEKLKREFKGRMRKMTPNQEHSKLSVIYQWIEEVSTYAMVSEQMDAVKKRQEILMKKHENEVPKCSSNALTSVTLS